VGFIHCRSIVLVDVLVGAFVDPLWRCIVVPRFIARGELKIVYDLSCRHFI